MKSTPAMYFVWLYVSSIKTGTRRVRRLDERSFVIRLERRISIESSSGRLSRLVPVFILDEFHRSRKSLCPSSSQTDYVSSVVRPVFMLGEEHGRLTIRLDGL